MITTAARSRWPSDIDIEDLAPTGLAHHSIIRWKVFTLPNAIFMRKLGQLGLTDMQKLTAELRQILPAV